MIDFGLFPKLPYLPVQMIDNRFDAEQIIKHVQFSASLKSMHTRLIVSNSFMWPPGSAPSDSLYINVIADFPDRDTDQIFPIGMTFLIKVPITIDDFLKSVRDNILSLMEHEVNESFLYRGVRIYDPHQFMK